MKLLIYLVTFSFIFSSCDFESDNKLNQLSQEESFLKDTILSLKKAATKVMYDNSRETLILSDEAILFCDSVNKPVDAALFLAYKGLWYDARGKLDSALMLNEQALPVLENNNAFKTLVWQN